MNLDLQSELNQALREYQEAQAALERAAGKLEYVQGLFRKLQQAAQSEAPVEPKIEGGNES